MVNLAVTANEDKSDLVISRMAPVRAQVDDESEPEHDCEP